MSTKSDILFSEKGQWNYFYSKQTLLGAATVRDLEFMSNQDTVVKSITIFNGEADATFDNVIYVSAGSDTGLITMGVGSVANYKDYLFKDEFVIPNGYHLTLEGSATALGYVGFCIVYKGGLSILKDSQS